MMKPKKLHFSMIFIALVFFIWSPPLLALSKMDQRKFENSIQLAEKKKYKLARRQLALLIKKYPKDPLLKFNYANILFLQKDYKNASVFFRAVGKSSANIAPMGWLYAAKSEKFSRRYEDAFISLRKLDGVNVPPNIKKEILREKKSVAAKLLVLSGKAYKRNNYKSSVVLATKSLLLYRSREGFHMRGLALYRLGVKGKARRSLSRALGLGKSSVGRNHIKGVMSALSEDKIDHEVKLTLAGGYDSNVFHEAFTVNSAQSSYFDLDAEYTRSLYSGSTSEWSFDGGLFFEDFVDFPTERFYNYSLGISWDGDSKAVEIGARFGFTHQFLGDVSYQLIPSIGIQLVKSFSSNGVRLAYNLEVPQSGSPRFNYLAGERHNFQLAYLKWTSHSRWLISLIGGVNNLGDFVTGSGLLPISGYNLGPDFEYGMSLSDKLSITLGSFFAYSQYYTRSLPDGKKRIDKSLSVRAGVTNKMSTDLWLEILSEYMKNDSTLDQNSIVDKNFSRFVLKIALTWEKDF